MNHQFDDADQFSDTETTCSVCLVATVTEYTQGYMGVCQSCTSKIDEQERLRLRPGCGCDYSYSPPRMCRPCGDAEDDAVDRAEERQRLREQRRLEAM